MTANRAVTMRTAALGVAMALPWYRRMPLKITSSATPEERAMAIAPRTNSVGMSAGIQASEGLRIAYSITPRATPEAATPAWKGTSLARRPLRPTAPRLSPRTRMRVKKTMRRGTLIRRSHWTMVKMKKGRLRLKMRLRGTAERAARKFAWAFEPLALKTAAWPRRRKRVAVWRTIPRTMPSAVGWLPSGAGRWEATTSAATRPRRGGRGGSSRGPSLI
jgi:hypothetical protein